MEDSQAALLSMEGELLSTAPIAAVPVYTAVPAALAGRRRGRAWVLSLAVHGGVVALALWGLGREVLLPPPPVRLVFVAPPPAPLGVPEGKGTVPVAEAPPPVVPPPVVEKPPEVPKPTPQKPKRLTVPKKIVKLQEIKPELPAPVEPATAEPIGEPQTGIATGSAEGVAGGIAGGVAGGTRGGTVGGTITSPLRIDQVAQPPLVISRVEPDYPEMARLRSIEGRVLLEAIVDREGRIEPGITVLQSVTWLDKAVMEALRQWRFTPGRDANGQAVRVIIEVPIRFVLE